MTYSLFKKVDAVTIPVGDLDAGLRFYRDALGHRLRWRNDAIGQAALAMADSETEIVLSTQLRYGPDWLVADVVQAVAVIVAAGGQVIAEPADIPVGQVAVVRDPFGNTLVLVDLSKGLYVTDSAGKVTAVERHDEPGGARAARPSPPR
jgi:predicted enzyme related to lactoylglutathione lyase